MAEFAYSPILLSVANNKGRHVITGQRITVSSLSVTHGLSFGSSADFTVPSADSGLMVGDSLLINTPIKTGEAFMVRSLSTDFVKNTTKVSCVSVAEGVLSDRYINGTITPADMSGTNTARAFFALTAAIRYVNEPEGLKQYATWGAQADMYIVDPTTTSNQHIRARGTDIQVIENGWSFTDVSVRDALQDIIDCIPQAEWQFTYANNDIHIKFLDLYIDRANPDLVVPECEMRRARNLSGLTVKVDRTGMFNVLFARGRGTATIYRCETRHVYSGDDPDNPPAGVPDLWHTYHEDYAYDLDSVKTWGIVHKFQSETSRYLNTAVNRQWFTDWAFSELAAHSTPKITITANALELAQMTGSSFDRLTPGAVVQIPLPEYGTVFTDIIRSVTFSDLVKDPYQCSVTVSNDVTTFKTLQYKQNGGSGSGRKKKQAQTEAQLGATSDYTDGLQNNTSARIMGAAGKWRETTINGSKMYLLVHD